MAAKGILISAGEASGDYYASLLAAELKRRRPETELFGCAGPHLRAEGVRAVIRTEDLAVVGIFEVLSHLPRIYARFRDLWKAARRERPKLAILTDAPDFHLRLAKKLKRAGIPVVYLVAPQAWAWRRHRVHLMRRVIDRLLCIFPFEEPFFRQYGVPAVYIGHPLAARVRPALTREEFFRKHNLPLDRPLITVLPGSRRGEAMRHLPDLRLAAEILTAARPVTMLLAASPLCGGAMFEAEMQGAPVRVIEGEAWDAIAHSDLALAASGTVTVEAALLGAPMVTYYRVSPPTWNLGRWLVHAPFFSMVNLIAGERVVPELIQHDMTGERIAEEALALLSDEARRERMKTKLAEIAARLTGPGDAIEHAADEVERLLESGA